MKKVPLNKGKFALVDDDDFERVSQHKWVYSNRGYARRIHRGKTIHMHRFVMSSDTLYDHINRDKLDNRKSNLRPCTRSQNQANRRTPANNTSGHKGVCYDKRRLMWRSYIRTNGKQRFLGYYKKIEDAILAYQSAADKYFGDFANY